MKRYAICIAEKYGPEEDPQGEWVKYEDIKDYVKVEPITNLSGCTQTVKDGPGWSPDGGHFVAKDNIIYWGDGDVSDLNKGGEIRIMPESKAPF